jgi:hypothetical protein
VHAEPGQALAQLVEVDALGRHRASCRGSGAEKKARCCARLELQWWSVARALARFAAIAELGCGALPTSI